ncbi:MAG: BamA/TamA family outer membrane protein [Bacteroidetes bacterium]|nr:BamA/TamA family outer membrane protein [Bacteroidota bacterium]
MTRLLFKFVILLYVFSPASVYSQTINSIEISGAEILSENIYYNFLSLQNSKLFEGINDTVRSRIQSKAVDYGFFKVQIDTVEIQYSPDSLYASLNIRITENLPAEIHNINFTDVDSSVNDELTKIVSYLQGSIFNKFELENSFNEILQYYEESGFPFANVKISSIYFFNENDNNYADVYLSIDKGLQSSIDELKIIGNDKTKDYVISRALRLQPGEKYSQSKINEIPNRLNRLRFFEPVETPVYYINPENKGVLQIKLKEKETNNFDGIVGYVPSSGNNDKGFFTGYVNISLRNLFGTGRAAAIRWQQESRNSQELELKYLEPWLFNYPFNISAGLFQRKQDTTYVIRNINGTVDFLASEDITASFIIESESTIPSDNGSNIFTVYNSSALSTGVNFTIDTRDDVYSATEGFLFKNTYIYKSKTIEGPAEFLTPGLETNINHQRLELDFSFFHTLFFRQVIAAEIHAREMRGGFFEISDLYKLGGTNTLRGYRENQFLGNRIFWSNLEYRYLLSDRSFAFLFFDAGYFLRNEDIENNIKRLSEIKLGYGLGMNLETALGIMGISFALGSGDSFSEGKIHFGLINEF